MWSLVGALDEVLECVEARRKVRIFGARLERLEVIGIAAAAHLDKQCVQVGGACPRDKVVDLARRLEAVVESVDPDGAQLGRIERLDGRGERGQKHRGC